MAEIDGCENPDCHDRMKGLLSQKISKKTLGIWAGLLVPFFFGYGLSAYSAHDVRITTVEQRLASVEAWSAHLRDGLEKIDKSIDTVRTDIKLILQRPR